MSTLSQFAGGGVPLGSAILLPGAIDNPTINGAEYLRSGVLKAVSGYEGLLAKSPQLGCIVGTDKGKTGNPANAIRFSGSTYYLFAGSSAPACSTDMLTWSTVTSDSTSGLTDAFAYGSYMIHLYGGIGGYYINNTIATAISGTTYGFNCGAVNSAGTLGVICAVADLSPDSIKTSANGSSWIARIPVGSVSGTPAIYLAQWSPVSSTFIYYTANGRIVTTSDGYTLTDRGLFGGLTSVELQTNYAASSFTAASPTVSLASVSGIINGVSAQRALIRTTDGVNFTVTKWSSLIPESLGAPVSLLESLGAPVSLLYVGGVFIASYFINRSVDRQMFYTSTDGLTWTPNAIPVSLSGDTAQSLINIAYDGTRYLCLSNPAPMYPVFTVSSLSATHIGLPSKMQSSVTTGYTSAAYYVRIK